MGEHPAFVGKLYRRVDSSGIPQKVEYMLTKTKRYKLEAYKNPDGQNFDLAKVKSEIATRFVEVKVVHSPLTHAIRGIVKSPASR